MPIQVDRLEAQRTTFTSLALAYMFKRVDARGTDIDSSVQRWLGTDTATVAACLCPHHDARQSRILPACQPPQAAK